MPLKLYSNFVNSAGERVRIGLALKGVPYEYVSVRTIGYDAYKKLNPQGLMPALEVDGRIFAQATAILEYLEETFPDRPLLPADPIRRGMARAFGQHITSEMHAIDVIRIRRFLHQDMGVARPEIDLWQRHWFGVGFNTLEQHLREREEPWPFCFGEEPGWADLHLVPQVRKGISRFNVDMGRFPLIAGIFERCRVHPAFIAAEPKNQPDFPGEWTEPDINKGEGLV